MPERRLEPLALRGRMFAWGSRTYIMGVINATPDSFSGDGIGDDPERAAAKAIGFERAGCDIIDIGGESTRPGHEPVSEDVEGHRALPAVRAVRARTDLPISIDTFKPNIAAAALEAGADIINCVWGASPSIVEVAARRRAPLIIMHNQEKPEYARDVVDEVIESLQAAAAQAVAKGCAPESIIVDPGIGFGKTAAHNIEILARLREFGRLPFPLLVGTSRKSFIGKITGLPVEERAFGTAASVTLAIAGGADIVRVHDVEAMRGAVQVADAVCRGGVPANIT